MREREQDRGLTLIEILISMTISLVLGAVLVAALITSLNVAGATSDTLKTAVDVRLISSYLARDAQGAAGTDPRTVTNESRALASVLADDWGDCAQAGSLVARFAWVDHITVSLQRTITVTWALDGTTLTRNYCVDGAAKPPLILGRTIVSASAVCLPTADCSGTPSSIEMTVTGRGQKSDYTTKLSASLRPRGQDFPTEASASTVSLLALGDSGTAAPCTNVALSTAKAVVLGDAVIANECGATSLTPDPADIAHPKDGVTSLTGNLLDPLSSLPTPSDTCGSGSNLALGSDGTYSPGTYPQRLTISSTDGTVTLNPGNYVFCNGLEIGSGASVSSSGGVLLYVKDGTLSIRPDSSVELTAASSGDQRNVLVWVATKQTVSIGTGDHITRLGGTIYAPKSSVVFNGSSNAAAINVGALVAATVAVSTSGSAPVRQLAPVSTVPIIRFGPIPTMSISPSELTSAVIGQPYSAPLSVIGDGASQLVNPRWSATGLSPFAINSVTGEITGTPECALSLTPRVRVVDDTGLAVSADYSLLVLSDLALSDPGDFVRGTKELTATLTDTCGGAGTSVSIQYWLEGGDTDVNGDPVWSTMCTLSVAPFQCSWVTTDTAKYTNGASYSLRAIATLSNSTAAESEIIEGVTIDNGYPLVTLSGPGTTPLRGTVTLVADASDNESGVARVRFEVSPKDLGAWMEICNETEPYDPANQSQYHCEWDTTVFVPAERGTQSYDIRAVVSDRAGNGAIDYLNNKSVNNNSASVSIVSPGAYVRGTVALSVNTYVPSPATVTSVLIQIRPTGGSWTDICTDTAEPWGCSWNTAGLTNNATYQLRAFMSDSRAVPPAESATVSTIVDNSVVYGADVQAANGSKLSYDSRKAIWATKSLRLGRLDQNKTDARNKPLTYDRILFSFSKQLDPSSIIAGWTGSSRTVWIRLRDKGVSGNYSTKNDTLDVCTTWASGATCAAVANLGWVKFALDTVAGGKTAIFESTISHQVVSGKSVITVGAVLKKYNDAKSTNLAVIVWTPSANARDTLGNGCSTQPAAETGTNDKDF